jgi:hypothetical protein
MAMLEETMNNREVEQAEQAIQVGAAQAQRWPVGAAAVFW